MVLRTRGALRIGEQANPALWLSLIVVLTFTFIARTVITNIEYESTSVRLLDACRDGQTAIVHQILQGKSAISLVNEVDKFSGWTSLHFATRFGHFHIARMLLEANADVNAQTKYWSFTSNRYRGGQTPLHYAVATPTKNFQIVRDLIQFGANLTIRDNGGESVVQALLSGHRHEADPEILQLLLQAGADPNPKENRIDFIDDEDEPYPPILQAILQDNAKLLAILLENGAKTNLRIGRLRLTPLSYAIFDDVHVESAKELIRRNIGLDSKDAHGWTPLHWVMDLSISEIYMDKMQQSPTSAAILQRKGEVLAEFIKSGTDLDPGKRNTPLGVAISMNREEFAITLINAGCSLNKLYNGVPMLHYAAKNGNIRLINVMVEKGIDMNVQSKSGKTALHYAIETHALNVVTALLEAGASPNMKDSRGMTPLDMALQIEKSSIMTKILEQYQSDHR